MEGPWEHPDWYDLHDNAWTAGPGREPEHYREFVIALPPLDRDDHLIDAGAGTGKLARMVADAYPNLGQVTLIDPNARKLVRAAGRIAEALPDARVQTIEANLGAGAPLPRAQGSLISIGSVLMPIMELRGRTLADGITWLRSVLGEVQNMLRPGGWLYDLETLGAPWAGAP